MNSERFPIHEDRQTKQPNILLIGLAVLCAVFVVTTIILNHLNNPDESVVQTAMQKASQASSKADEARIWLWATQHFDPSNAHDGEQIAEEIALSGCKPEFIKELDAYLRNEGASLPLDRKQFLQSFAFGIPDHIKK
jgi:hypothetical protein